MLTKHEFEKLFNLYFHPLCKYLLLFTDDYAMIEDAVQTVYTKLWEGRERISGNHIKTYLFVSSKNRILNSIRNQQRRRNLLQDYLINELEKENAEDIIDINDFSSLVEKSIEQLPSKTKDIFCLSRYSSMSYKEIALQKDISVKTVESHISKALQKINTYINSYYKKK